MECQASSGKALGVIGFGQLLFKLSWLSQLSIVYKIVIQAMSLFSKMKNLFKSLLVCSVLITQVYCDPPWGIKGVGEYLSSEKEQDWYRFGEREILNAFMKKYFLKIDTNTRKKELQIFSWGN